MMLALELLVNCLSELVLQACYRASTSITMQWSARIESSSNPASTITSNAMWCKGQYRVVNYALCKYVTLCQKVGH